MSVKRPMLRYHGGKFRIGPWVLDNMPAQHSCYVEPFGGSASVLLQKPRIPAEIYNDLDGRVVNVFRCLQDAEKAAAIERRLSFTPFARTEFERCYEPAVDDVDAACKAIVIGFFGFGTDSMTRSCRTGFRGKMSDSRATPAQAWATYPKAIASFVTRLQGVVIENCVASDLIRRYDTAETLFFVDPPYVIATRSSVRGRGAASGAYKFEMSDQDHRSLAEQLNNVCGMVMLCGYPSMLYQELYAGWNMLQRAARADHGAARTECLWFNPRAWQRRAQGEIFSKTSVEGGHNASS